MTSMLDDIRRKVDSAVVEDPEKGIYRARRNMFTDPDLFELEMKYIFEGNWIYLAHESQLPNNNDYLTMWMGRQPVIVSRTRTGEITAVLNACAHRGAMVCRRKKDNRSTWTCPFHGWTYSNNGKLLKVKEAKGAGYPEQFNKDGSHDMPKLSRFESYRGFLFGSLNPDVLPLEQHLGETTKLIDMMVDASPEGLEVLKGASTYTYDGNWKVQAENGADGYHVAATHWNYAATTARRSTGESVTETRAMDAGSYGKTKGGFYAFEHGHVLLWTTRANPEDEPLYGPFFAAVTSQDLRLRFFAPVKEFGHRFIARLTQIDYARAMAFVAIEEATGNMLGVIRLHADANYDSGEYAVLVRSDLKGRGLGYLLMQLIIEYTSAEGLKTIEGQVLSENTAMLAMCKELGFDIALDPRDPDTYMVKLAIREPVPVS